MKGGDREEGGANSMLLHALDTLLAGWGESL